MSNADNSSSPTVLSELNKYGLFPFSAPSVQSRETTAIIPITITDKGITASELKFRDLPTFQGLFARFAVSTITNVAVRFRKPPGCDFDIVFAYNRSGIPLTGTTSDPVNAYSRVRSMAASAAFSIVGGQVTIADYRATIAPPPLVWTGRVVDGAYLGMPEPAIYYASTTFSGATITAGTINLEVTLTIDGHGVGGYYV